MPMVERYDVPTGSRLALAQRLFEAMTDWEALARRDAPAIPARAVTVRRLYEYARDPSTDGDGEVRAALSRDLGLVSDFRRAVGRAPGPWVPQVAAAAGSDGLESRDGEGCRVRIARSVAEPDQVYVMIDLDDPEAVPTTLFVVDRNGRLASWPVPPARHGLIQLIEERDSALVRALRDPGTQIFLR